ncbi:hypothetical protein [Ethanoligenens harbinense]|uniref:Uncharacterized protein n=1 Tax=Ethanoligenens harbinense (strain DSM 18485 / JCM 12961 / CGMCC 1.5033 / YUAN-3) TaxID=663278 RepID=E6U892_ETHHY|nr:hypothetical protein [Ethanoligenens harbinense]ADU27111.1 hypothetical protein Ethha_1575 [Ethanoligenens harbinense YUAN-3]AVQ96186.1 hypothetical protein CXQ68_08085 [Ethanoligenens harbinense YUAN-3]AYF38846.1 hypothetical protein CXP51_07955 [Ethanoligenens harbinense]AYF41596.1 hypothetical protein CN246_08100 [Ethanoligenens harbinense]QCN92427.1 hypothetical protein DRA42_08115 [Ethanoligenens harbinense]
MAEHATELFFLTPAAGKRLIAKAVCALTEVKRALQLGTVVVLAGTTNCYVAQEIMVHPLRGGAFDRQHFFRGITLPPATKMPEQAAPFPGDLIIEKGVIQKGQTIFDVAPRLGKGDIIIKGANAVDTAHRTAGILVGNPQLGTSGAILEAVVGRRAGLIVPVGLEKRVPGDIGQIAAKLDASSASGLRMLPVNVGSIVTELEAIRILAGAEAELAAAGGVGGAEGGCWILVTGTEPQLDIAAKLLKPLVTEPAFAL